jgi:hypothetical protein
VIIVERLLDQTRYPYEQVIDLQDGSDLLADFCKDPKANVLISLQLFFLHDISRPSLQTNDQLALAFIL